MVVRPKYSILGCNRCTVARLYGYSILDCTLVRSFCSGHCCAVIPFCTALFLGFLNDCTFPTVSQRCDNKVNTLECFTMSWTVLAGSVPVIWLATLARQWVWLAVCQQGKWCDANFAGPQNWDYQQAPRPTTWQLPLHSLGERTKHWFHCGNETCTCISHDWKWSRTAVSLPGMQNCSDKWQMPVSKLDTCICLASLPAVTLTLTFQQLQLPCKLELVFMASMFHCEADQCTEKWNPGFIFYFCFHNPSLIGSKILALQENLKNLVLISFEKILIPFHQQSFGIEDWKIQETSKISFIWMTLSLPQLVVIFLQCSNQLIFP